MASVTKLFVGTSIILLEKEGKIGLEDKLTDILDWFRVDDERVFKIRIIDMLTHTSGLADVIDYQWDKPLKDTNALKKYLTSDEVAKSQLIWNPGEDRFKYSNIAYEALGAIIAQVSGLSFEDYVEKNIFTPLNMNNSKLLTYLWADGSLCLDDLRKSNLAMPHMKDERNHIVYEPYYPYNRAHGPSSTLTTNLIDMEKWANGILNNTILSKEDCKRIWEPRALVPNNGEHIGLSWFIREQNGYTLYGHEGNDNGFRASFWICPKLGLHIVVSSNISKAPVKNINKSVFDIITSHPL